MRHGIESIKACDKCWFTLNAEIKKKCIKTFRQSKKRKQDLECCEEESSTKQEQAAIRENRAKKRTPLEIIISGKVRFW